jgi:propionyl-CoA synthetase
VADDLKGEVPLAFVVLQANSRIDEKTIEHDIVKAVQDEVGHIASLKHVLVVPQLPKTRSGKLLRRTMRAMYDGEAFRVPSTIEDASVLDTLAKHIETIRP